MAASDVLCASCAIWHGASDPITVVPGYESPLVRNSLEIIVFLGPVRKKFHLSGDWLVEKTTCPAGQVIFNHYLSGYGRQLSGTTGQALMSHPVGDVIYVLHLT